MKTKLLNLAVTLFAVSSLSAGPTALPIFPRHQSNTSPKVEKIVVMDESCKGGACCATKTVTTGLKNGRAAQPAVKKVRTCEMACDMTAQEQRSVCLKGKRA